MAVLRNDGQSLCHTIAATAGGDGAPPNPAAAKPAVAPAAAGVSSVLSELSKGGSVTAGLKHVDKSQMTHKNPSLRASSVVHASQEKSQPSPSGQSEAPRALPPKQPTLELRDSKWIVVLLLQHSPSCVPSQCALCATGKLHGQ